MSKYSDEFKGKVIPYYLKHDYGHMEIAKYFKMTHQMNYKNYRILKNS